MARRASMRTAISLSHANIPNPCRQVAGGRVPSARERPCATSLNWSGTVPISLVRTHKPSEVLGVSHVLQFLVPLDGADGGTASRYRCQPAPIHAACLQLHGRRTGADR